MKTPFRTRLILFFSIFIGLSLSTLVLASNGTGELDWPNMTMGLFGGLALFLFGMEQMSDALKAAAGSRMKDILSRLTRNRVSAAIGGAAVTAVIQSSSVTTVLVVGFVSAGLMSMTQSIGIILGANIGTTITAHIVAFKVSHYALLLIAAGFATLFMAKTRNARHYGNIIMGLGLIFFGMGIMSDAMAPLREYQPFIDFMIAMEQPWLGILVAAGFTALVQSSSATTGLVIVMATQGFITLNTGIAMALGANIGTCVTALLASIGKPTEAVRAASVHIVFNVAGAILWVGFIDQLAVIAMWLSPAHPELDAAARLAAESPRQIANANTAFNVINTVVFLLFAEHLGRFIKRIIPTRKQKSTVIVAPRFIDDNLLSTPSLALSNVRMEIGHMGGYLHQMITKVRSHSAQKSAAALADIALIDDKLDILQQAIFEHLSKVRGQAMSDEEAITFQQLLSITAHVETAGDIIEREIIPLLERVIESQQEPSQTTQELLNDLGEIVSKGMENAIHSITQIDEKLAEKVVQSKEQLQLTVQKIYQYQAQHIGTISAKRLALLRMEMELSERLQRLHAVARRIAREALPANVAIKVR